MDEKKNDFYGKSGDFAYDSNGNLIQDPYKDLTISSRTHLLVVFITIYFRYLGFKNTSIAIAIEVFLKPK